MTSRLFCGIGINDADYTVNLIVDGKFVTCPVYKTWGIMLTRAYSPKYKINKPTYRDVTVYEDWITFSRFREWMVSQPYTGMQLDKDILVDGNMMYSPNACCFVPGYINILLSNSFKTKQSNLPLGVSYRKKGHDMINEYKRPYVVHLKMSMLRTNRGAKKLGGYETPEEAHRVWQINKADLIESIVNYWKNDPESKHSFRDNVAEALMRRVTKLRLDAINCVETISL